MRFVIESFFFYDFYVSMLLFIFINKCMKSIDYKLLTGLPEVTS